MSLIRVCDRCKKETNEKFLTAVELYEITNDEAEGGPIGEFCEACRKAVYEFAQNRWVCPENHWSYTHTVRPYWQEPYISTTNIAGDISSALVGRENFILNDGAVE